jgi:D-sedoheptulose 7-phosphate isomerase
MQRSIAKAFAASVAAKRAFLAKDTDRLIAAIETIRAALDRDNKLLLFGNGGSAADAQHIAAELVGRYQSKRRALAAIALTTDTSALTAIANDYRYDDVFARQVEALGRPGDIALAISTSGRSRSVCRAASVCRRVGITVIALTGGDGGKLATLADIVLCVGSTSDTARIQETHILIGHVICEQIELAVEKR